MNNQNTQVAYTVSYLKDNMALWWKSVTNGAEDSTIEWKMLKVALIEQFKSANTNKLTRDQLANLKQMTSVQVYAFSFQAIILEISNIAESKKLDRFVRG